MFSVNNWFSPLGTARQPTYYDYFSQNYTQYVASGCKFTVKAVNNSTTNIVTFGYVLIPDPTTPFVSNTAGAIDNLITWPRAKHIVLGAAPGTHSIGILHNSVNLTEMYSRRGDVIALNNQKNIKASTTATHPYDMVCVLYFGKTDGVLPIATTTLTYELLVTYTGYFIDRVNSFPS